ncbi:hypothetical protein GJV85_12985 [Sulfurimonas aquatica]|uniref:Uncharacterized protein n=1 Tax=Sulfurimonas aquatica TaxID=2672570 RepID=A0A975GE20_9BACT|nr:hypothetical protein [Sulfurimonas aquatica]QSZ42983.1 hypothetical protein GJV85_12985 [Sulfurimonas aquatica]
MKKLFLVSFITLLAFATSSFAKDISAYLTGKYIDEKSVKEKLANAGFEVVASYESVKKGTTIVFTNSALKKEAAKEGRAFAAVLRVFVDAKDKMISFTNPEYFGIAYMQDDYKASVFESQLKVINKEFRGLKGSKDILEDDDIAGYHFMMGMPYYEDYDTLAKGSNEELLAKAKSYKKGKLLLFEIKLSDNSTLLGYDLGRRTKKFVKKIGRANGAVLPYCISIENGEAKSLEAKYYLALSYPLLSMGEFTTIASVPGAIKKDLSKPFK